MIQNIFLERSYILLFSVSAKILTLNIRLFNEFHNPVIFIFDELPNLILSPTIPIVSVYSEFPVLYRK